MLHVSWNFFTKSSTHPKTFSLVTNALTAGLALPLLLVLPLGEIPAVVWVAIVLSGGIHALYGYALSSAYETGDISYVYPLARSAPAFIPVLAFVTFGETVSMQGWVGIGLVSACILLLQLSGETLKESVVGIWSYVRSRHSVWAFVTLGTVIAYSLNDKMGMVAFNRVSTLVQPLHVVVYFFLFTPLSSLLYALLMLWRQDPIDRRVWRLEWPQALVAVVGSLASYGLILYVMQTEPLSYIVALRQASVLFAVVLGWRVLREDHGWRRLAISGVMLVGLLLVAMAR